MKVRSALGILMLMLTLGVAIPAAHAQYPPTVANGRVTRSEVKKCQCTIFTGDGFQPGSSVVIFDRAPDGSQRTLGTARVDDRGGFRFRACFDETAQEGEHTLIARGTGADGRPREARAQVRVEGDTCFRRGDEVHDERQFREDDPQNGPGSNVGGTRNNRGSDGLPRTGADYVLPGLLLGFVLVVTGSGVVHLTRRRRPVTG